MFSDSNSPLKLSAEQVRVGGWDTVDAIKSLRPNAAFMFENKEFTQYFDIDRQKPPTWEEIVEEAVRLKSIVYKAKRKQEYPLLEDFVDAYYWQQKGDSSKMEDYIKRVDVVKQRFPKP
jgi:hypothetical protein